LHSKKQKGDYTHLDIFPANWHYAKALKVTPFYERPELHRLREVPQQIFFSEVNVCLKFPFFVETNGACAGNQEKLSPGGWGAVIVHQHRYCTLLCKKADTSNNEMEYRAMLSALELIPKKAYICFETDSQQRIDGLTKYRQRWGAHRWRREDGQPVANAETIRKICPSLDHREVGFRKIKGHSQDPWNDLADPLAVR
jgi:ribonuclease HI